VANIPDWLTKLAGTAKYLPLEARQAMLPGVVGKLHKAGVLSELTGENLSQAAVYMSHFLGGSGEPLELEISDDEWKVLIKTADKGTQTVYPGDGTEVEKKNPWTPSTNPEYHADQGWEWKQITPSYELSDIDNTGFLQQPGLYHILGSTTTVRRRKIDKDKYEYQIAEDFDFTEGEGPSKGGQIYTSGRVIPSDDISKLIEAVFPEYTESEILTWEDDTEYESWKRPSQKREPIDMLNVKKALKGVPVPIKSSYIHNSNRSVEDDLVDGFNKMDKLSISF